MADFELEGTVYEWFTPEVVASEPLEGIGGIEECFLSRLVSIEGGARLGGDPADSGADTRKNESPISDCIIVGNIDSSVCFVVALETSNTPSPDRMHSRT